MMNVQCIICACKELSHGLKVEGVGLWLACIGCNLACRGMMSQDALVQGFCIETEPKHGERDEEKHECNV